MRNARLPLAALLLGLVACKADSFPTTPNGDLAGMYKLTTINGIVLPFTFRPDSVLVSGAADTTTFRETRYQEDYELLSTGRFRYTIVDSAVTHTTDGSADVKDDFSIIEVGTWQQAANRVRLTADSITLPGQSPEKLTTPDVWEVPLPNASGISGTAIGQHASLGPNSTVFVNYDFFYPRQ